MKFECIHAGCQDNAFNFNFKVLKFTLLLTCNGFTKKKLKQETKIAAVLYPTSAQCSTVQESVKAIHIKTKSQYPTLDSPLLYGHPSDPYNNPN